MHRVNKADNRNKQKNSQGFSLIELVVATAILAIVMTGMVSVSVSVFRSYQRSKAIKASVEDIGFAINSMTKDVRMGKIESGDSIGDPPQPYFIVTRNRTMDRVCYLFESSTALSVCDGTCTAATCEKIVDLSKTGMTFNMLTTGFRSKKTDSVSSPSNRGWVEININTVSSSMEDDLIQVQSIVSSRDYGWESF